MTTSNLRQFKQKLSSVARLWDEQKYDKALHEVESLMQAWPGNAHLPILWASLVQLVESPRHQLDEAKLALQQAMELDKDSPAAAIEMVIFSTTSKIIRGQRQSILPTEWMPLESC